MLANKCMHMQLSLAVALPRASHSYKIALLGSNSLRSLFAAAPVFFCASYSRVAEYNTTATLTCCVLTVVLQRCRRCQSSSFNVSCRCLCRHTTRSAPVLLPFTASIILFILLCADYDRTRQTTCSSCQTRPRTCCLCCWDQCHPRQLSYLTYYALSRFACVVFGDYSLTLAAFQLVPLFPLCFLPSTTL